MLTESRLGKCRLLPSVWCHIQLLHSTVSPDHIFQESCGWSKSTQHAAGEIFATNPNDRISVTRVTSLDLVGTSTPKFFKIHFYAVKFHPLTGFAFDFPGWSGFAHFLRLFGLIGLSHYTTSNYLLYSFCNLSAKKFWQPSFTYLLKTWQMHKSLSQQCPSSYRLTVIVIFKLIPSKSVGNDVQNLLKS